MMNETTKNRILMFPIVIGIVLFGLGLALMSGSIIAGYKLSSQGLYSNPIPAMITGFILSAIGISLVMFNPLVY